MVTLNPHVAECKHRTIKSGARKNLFIGKFAMKHGASIHTFGFDSRSTHGLQRHNFREAQGLQDHWCGGRRAATKAAISTRLTLLEGLAGILVKLPSAAIGETSDLELV